MKLTLIFLLFIFATNLFAQKFIKSVPGKKIEFLEMQRQFNDWKKIHNLKKEKGWKSFKRWEHETQLHTNANGIPVDSKIMLSELLRNTRSANTNSKTTTFNATWFPFGPNSVPDNQTGYMENGIGRINCIAFDPIDPAKYYIGVAQGGVWKTTNNGLNWTPLTDNLPITRVSNIAIDPNNTDIIYISLCDFEYIGVSLNLSGRKRNTHYGFGVYKSIDGGATWNPTGLAFQLTQGDESLIRKIVVNKTNSNKLVACGVNGMFTSNDAGASWTKTMDSLFWDLQEDPTNPNMLYAATGWVMTANDGNAGVYKSTDFGQTWTLLNTGMPLTGSIQRVKLAIAPSDPNYIYALTVDLDRGLYGFYKSIDAGINWQYISPALNILEYDQGFGTGGQGNYDLGLIVDASNKNRVIAGGINVWVSDDACLNFNPATHWTTSYGPTVHADIHEIMQQPSTGNIFVCSDGGLNRTANVVPISWTDALNGTPWPTQWTNLSNGMQTTAFYRLSSAKNTTETLVAGAQDNATFFYDATTLSWRTVYGGDGMDNYVDPANNNTIIASAQFGSFGISNDGGFNFGFCDPNVLGGNAEWTTPIIADYSNPGTLYAGFGNVSKSTDNGNSWIAISSFPPDPNSFYESEISCLAVSSTNADVLLAAKRVRYEYSIPGVVYSTNDGGANWTDITAGIPDSLYYTSVEINSSSASTFYITMAGFSNGNKVFKTTNSGANWQNISYNLPNLPVNCIKQIPGTNDLMIACDVGIYVLRENTTNWVSVSNGLPNVIISDIEINEALNKVYISTFGRGIWAANLNELVSIKDKANIASSFELSPSPNNGSFKIKVPSKISSKTLVKFEVIDICGKIVYSETLKNDKIISFDLKLNPGMYHAKITGDNIYGVSKFIVQ